ERVGTPRYMAPEQHGGAPVTEVADQFAFATALWSALYRAAPFEGSSAEELRAKIARGPRSTAGHHVPGHIEAALRRALALKPEYRWPALGDHLSALPGAPHARRHSSRLAGVVAY